MLRFTTSLLVLVGLTAAGLRPTKAAEVDANRPQGEDRLDPSAGWREVDAFAAPEARQAAAADEKFFYAIDNTTVAAYDRQTRKRVWRSRGGDATHLNSGFVWDGRLFCAHSNYPHHPNTSEIKVVDVVSGQMSDFKEFGVTDGSLTWAVRHDGAWWCNFAYYGDQQQQTRLVRYDDQWQELGSWTYPQSLFSRLGRHSLSGGIWHDGTLLVTDHDHNVIYRLRLPAEGTVLQWIDSQPAPFTGQGFAIDPLGRGLIGIDRSRRRVILAGPAPQNVSEKN